MNPTLYIATRGSALALAQANIVLTQCRVRFPELNFALKVIKTTGDKMQAINLTNPNQDITKGLFTRELELSLLAGETAFAVHSLKDLPTELPPELHLSGVSKREDARDVLIYRDAKSTAMRGHRPHARVRDFANGAIATSSTRRQAQLLALNPELKTVPIRGNVGSRIRKLWEQPDLDGIVLAFAGIKRLGFMISPAGELLGAEVPKGTMASLLSLEEMLPCAGQAALGYECRKENKEINRMIAAINDAETFNCVAAERSFLAAMGGGCLSPVAAYAEVQVDSLFLRAISFRDGTVRRTEERGKPSEAVALGHRTARTLSI